MHKLNAYRKTIAAVVTGLIGWATAVVVSDPDAIVAAEWISLATVLAIALGVYGITNEPADVEAFPETEHYRP